MFENFIFDLKVARKKSGLTQADCGHLIGSSKNVISQIELGQRVPTVSELCSLSLIYGRSFDSFYADTLRKVRKDLASKLKSMPSEPKGWPGSFARRRTLARLTSRLEEEANEII
ncbi:helix-turn-helix domain-containing protein [Thiosulfatihalobacter marinus]|uniref:helix-turn-helix domain-containing protein n=1 Tax=Thiosulfatihalobacter marinus TaxID=2792481 RepID=UPI0018D87B39|nr:helix-turn-helix transcriptional regulator [Thiosulfatihalobacter marinus]